MAEVNGDDISRELPSITVMSKTVHARARKNTPPIKEAKSLRDLDTDPIRNVTCANGQSILWYDSGYTQNGRFLVLSTLQNVEKLRNCKIVAVDGTFSVSFLHKDF